MKINRIEGFMHCTNIWLMYVDGFSELKEIPSMETLVSLEELRVSEHVKLKRIQGLVHYTKLQLL